MSESFTTVWAQSTAVPRSTATIIGLMLIALAGFAFARWRARRARPRDTSGMQSNAGSLATQTSKALFYVAAVPFVVALLIASFEIPRWINLKDRLAKDGERVIEGTVERNQTWLKTGSGRSPSTRMYAIQVSGKRFEWPEGSGERFDALVEPQGGGVLRVGKAVRVRYADMTSRNELISIEAENLCRLYPKCSAYSVFGWRWEVKQ